MTKTQQLFKTLGYTAAIEFLQAEPRNIKVKEYDDFVVLNYCQISSKKDDEYVMECRSLQIGKMGDIVSRAFPRFFNYGEAPHITGNFKFDNDTSYLEKSDGSMVRTYWNKYSQKWEVATRGTAFAEAEQDFYPTFRQAIIEDGFGFSGEEKFQEFCENNLAKTNTYVFEYTSIKNHIVTIYENPQMVLLTVIDNEYGTELSYEYMQHLFTQGWLESYKNIRLVNRYKFSSYDEMKYALDNLPDLQEGFVAQDSTGLRVKFKNSLYLKLHSMRGDLGFTPKKIATVVADGEEDEVLTYFGQYKHLFDPIIAGRVKLFGDIYTQWVKYKNIESQKDFALQVKDLPYSAILFAMRKGKQFSEVWDNLRMETKIDLILGMVIEDDC